MFSTHLIHRPYRVTFKEWFILREESGKENLKTVNTTSPMHYCCIHKQYGFDRRPIDTVRTIICSCLPLLYWRYVIFRQHFMPPLLPLLIRQRALMHIYQSIHVSLHFTALSATSSNTSHSKEIKIIYSKKNQNAVMVGHNTRVLPTVCS